jgi:hypothetical protein
MEKTKKGKRRRRRMRMQGEGYTKDMQNPLSKTPDAKDQKSE